MVSDRCKKIEMTHLRTIQNQTALTTLPGTEEGGATNMQTMLRECSVYSFSEGALSGAHRAIVMSETSWSRRCDGDCVLNASMGLNPN